MIARQRQNLSRTFAAQQMAAVSPLSEDTLKRLKTTESELLEATREFDSGLNEIDGADPTLIDPLNPIGMAAGWMEEAITGLDESDLELSRMSQSEALASLIRARKNLLQKLAQQGSGSSAAQCRNFDFQQSQKLRSPEDLKAEQREQLAQVRDELEQSAEQQRRWSEEVRERARSGAQLDQQQQQQQQQSQSSSSSSQAQPQEQQQQAQTLGQRQQQARDRLEELFQKLEQSEQTSGHTQQQLADARDAVADSLRELERNQADSAADRADQAAERLDEIADHLAALNAAGFSEQLGASLRMARRLADRQDRLSREMAQASTANPQSGSQSGGGNSQGGTPNEPDSAQRAVAQRAGIASEQSKLAGESELLADLLARLQGSALSESSATQRALSQLNPTELLSGVGGNMREAASEIAGGDAQAAVRAARMAQTDLSELAAGLRSIRDEHVRPQLAELLQTEARIAELLQALQRSQSEGELSRLGSQQQSLQEQLDALAERDAVLAGRLAEQAGGTGQRSDNSNQQSSSTNPANPGSTALASAGTQPADTASGGSADVQSPSRAVAQNTGFQRSRQVQIDGVRELSRILQDRIQEMILSTAVDSSDEAVPVQYRPLVDEYYRRLSDDLRSP